MTILPKWWSMAKANLRPNPRAAVLGAGPAGMFATHALAQAGYQVDIYSIPRQSHMHGAQYLHRPIPGLPERPFDVEYVLHGTAEGYAQRVYGSPEMAASVSPASLEGVGQAWDIRMAYGAAYEMYSGLIKPWDFRKQGGIPGWWESQVGEWANDSRNIVISTIPRQVICLRPEEHKFSAAKVWAIGDADEERAPVRPPLNRVICNGDPDGPRWYRASNIQGYCTVEWPYDCKPPIPGVAEVEKPLTTNCDCYLGLIRFAGRYGAWRKGYLAHQAYYETREMIGRG